jgi:hypothetical protein
MILLQNLSSDTYSTILPFLLPSKSYLYDTAHYMVPQHINNKNTPKYIISIYWQPCFNASQYWWWTKQGVQLRADSMKEEKLIICSHNNKTNSELNNLS